MRRFLEEMRRGGIDTHPVGGHRPPLPEELPTSRAVRNRCAM